ncbi:MAG TPA: serine/threonine-protein kinase [Kofleriaceae bacterium]|nr:serine/threonine-protein kinase [Kofleriaceae bacterium]
MRPSSGGAGKRSAGRYVLGDLLGRGGMAEVFAGHALGDHGFQKPVAIKRLLPELASDHVFVERLIEEAKLLVGMQHGNIVSVLDLARDGDDVFLVMEFVDGPSLRQLLKSRGTRGVSLGTATYIVQSSAAGLEFAHNRPGGAIIHADISPSNLLLTTSGEVRVADFGIARREGGGYGVVEGKWAYMAPEQARGEPLTPRSDVFALGVVLYELICGAHPFGRQVTHEERDSEPMRVIPPRVVKPSIPAGLDAICMRALAHDPRDRYKSMQSMIDAIVEERFANHWREGASDLAYAIREGVPNAFAANPRTMVTDRPVTIMTRSLLRDLTPPRRSSSPSEPSRSEPRSELSRSEPRSELSRSEPRSESRSVSRSELYSEVASRSASGFEHSDVMAPIASSGAQTTLLVGQDLARAAAMLEIPPMFRADGAPMPAFRFPEVAVPAGQDLASVVGGHTMTGHQVASEPMRSTRGAVAILGIATLIGIAAAVAFHLKPSATEAAPSVAIDERRADRQEPLPTPSATPSAGSGSDIQPTFPKQADPPPSTPSTSPTPPSTSPTPPTPPDEPSRPAGVAGTERPSGIAGGRTITSPPAPPSRPASKKEPGFLRVHTTPWAWATVGTEKQDTPAAKFKLTPGRYTVRLNFPTLGITETHQVTIESMKTFTLNINKEEE